MSDTVDTYIAAAAEPRRQRLAAVRALVRDVAPDVTEGLDWKMPVFRRGEHWVAMANQKSYLSVYLGCEPLAQAVAASDPRLKAGKSCVNIADRAELPLAALRPAIAEALGCA